jgi:hypothetical protein
MPAKWRRLFQALTLFAPLSGCAVVDQYAGRAVGFNLEAEQATQQALLLNIVRASHRKPMQFTGLQSITGTASASMSGGLSTIPIGPHSTAAKIGTLTGSVSGGPNFIVPVLDTQEFYQGILSPIPGQILDLYFNSNYSRELILDLFIEKVVMRRHIAECPPIDHSERCEFTILNYVSGGPHYDIFQVFIEHMLNFGLRTQLVKKPNPPAKKTAKADDKKDDTSTPALGVYAMCFAPTLREYHRHVPPQARCGATLTHQKNKDARSDNYDTALTMPAFVVDSMQYAAGLISNQEEPLSSVREQRPISQRLEWFKDQAVSLTFYTRHTERLFYYLGEIVARQHDAENRRVIRFRSVRGGLYRDPTPCAPDSRDTSNCQNILVVETGLSPASLSVGYNGGIYSIPDDKLVAGRSFFVLDVLKQVLAINTSAKSLPASNLLSVINAQ